MEYIIVQQKLHNIFGTYSHENTSHCQKGRPLIHTHIMHIYAQNKWNSHKLQSELKIFKLWNNDYVMKKPKNKGSVTCIHTYILCTLYAHLSMEEIVKHVVVCLRLGWYWAIKKLSFICTRYVTQGVWPCGQETTKGLSPKGRISRKLEATGVFPDCENFKARD